MTLGRFVRVTLHNFRLLINAFSGSAAAPLMPDPISSHSTDSSLTDSSLSLTDSSLTDSSLTDSSLTDSSLTGSSLIDSASTLAAAPIEGNTLPGATAEAGATGNELPAEIAADTVVQEPVVYDTVGPLADEHLQPALNLANGADGVVLAAETESNDLSVRAGETALSLPGALESLLFVADAPVETIQLARALNAPVEAVEAHLRRLAEEYRAQARGLRVAERNGRFQMVTSPAAATLIETFLNLDMTTKLSAPALETLAVVAYRQPVTRAQVEAVRGVDCSGILRSLLQRGLVEEVDRLDAPGRPVLYGVTDLFMQHFGLTGLHELPPLESNEVEQLDNVLEQEPP
jgi:segregation and condensation protein B